MTFAESFWVDIQWLKQHFHQVRLYFDFLLRKVVELGGSCGGKCTGNSLQSKRSMELSTIFPNKESNRKTRCFTAFIPIFLFKIFQYTVTKKTVTSDLLILLPSKVLLPSSILLHFFFVSFSFTYKLPKAKNNNLGDFTYFVLDRLHILY